MILTPRLLKIAQMVNYAYAADIGTDHAKLPVYLIENNICKKVIASDVADGPVSSCRKTVTQSGFENCIDIRKGDGLASLKKNETETIIIAGMGGDLISYILEKDSQIAAAAKEIILQPMTHIIQLRKFLHDNCFAVIDEVLVREKEKIYTIIKVKKGDCQYKSEMDYILSPVLLKNKDQLLSDLINRLIKKYKAELLGLKKASNPDDNAVKQIVFILENLEKIYETAKNN